MRMLDEFLHKQEIDILLLQEVTHTVFDMIRYIAHTDVGIHNRSTAMITREHVTLTNITRLLSGRNMAACYRGVWIINIYMRAVWRSAQAGEERLLQRGTHFSLAVHFPNDDHRGDFNCVLSQADYGEYELRQSPRQISTRLRPYRFVGNYSPRAIYTHYTPHGAARLDRMYLSQNRRSGVGTVIVAFTDHSAV
jgi:endonuclease/exonuclease/phosphatase family metal-dependent hydrolase